MTLGQFLSALRARWWVVLLVLATVVGATTVASLLWPKRYTATASVVVDVKPDPVSTLLYPGMGTPAFMATQVDIISSDRVAQRVVKNLKMTDNPQIRQQWLDATGGQGSVEEWLGGTLSAAMEVKPSRESNVITVSYKAADARFAAGMANAFVQAYIDVSLDMRVTPAKEYSGFFDTRLKEAREALEQAQAKVSAFQRQNGIIATDERLDVESARLAELSSQLVGLQSISAESGSRQSAAQGSNADRVQDVLNNPLLLGLKSDIARGEAGLEQLNARLGDRHPQVVEAKASLGELRAKLESETKRVLGGVTVSNTINKSRESQVRGELEAQRAKLLKLKAVRDAGQVLARDVENAQRAYDVVQGRLTQTSLESQTRQSNLAVLNQATVPLNASSPRVLLNILLAVFVGTVLAISAALAWELLDRHVRDPHDLVAMAGVPVLAVLPNGKKRLGSSRKLGALTQARVLGQLPAPAAKGA